jgi:coenzyme F420-reducing hydrogenase alpha subunit
MTPGGELEAEIVTRAGVVSEVRIVATRRVPLSAALRGKSVAEAVTLVPLLFATCGIAHGVAASAAVRSATGEGEGAAGGPRARRAWARELLVASEVIDGHAWSILVDWPRAIGAPLETERVRALRAATAALRDAIDPARASLRGGDCTLTPAPEKVAEALARIEALVGEIVRELPDDADGLEAWARGSRTPASSFVRHLLATSTASVGASDVSLLPELGARWFAERLSSDATFGAWPTMDGAARESGPLARAATAPRVASVIARHGRGALARVVARLTELASLPLRVRAVLAAGEVAELGAEGGCGIADTARGRLAHWARIESGVVVDWRFVAPTEWTFHPDGAFPRGLVGAPAHEAARAVQVHLAALDPCVPCGITLREET